MTRPGIEPRSPGPIAKIDLCKLGRTTISSNYINKHYIDITQRSLEKRIYEHKRSIKINDDWNVLFSHMFELKHAFHLFQATLIKPILSKKTPKTTRICGHFQNKPYKTTSRFYQISPYQVNLIINEKKVNIENGGKKHFFTLCLHTFEKTFLFLSLWFYLLVFPHPNYNLDTII